MNSKVQSVPPVWKRDWFWGVLLIAGTLAAYWPALSGKFIWDDDSWTTSIEGLLRDFSGLCALWRHPSALQQYYPLAGTTFWLDYHLWGLWTLPYHVENVALHAGAALLFWQLLRRLEVPGAWLAAGIFALHPVMVESVAWITERKNVLSLVFFLSSLLAYGRFAAFWEGTNDSAAPRRWGAYALAFVLSFCAMLSKTTTFSLPAVIVLIGWWKRGSLQWKKDMLPTLPFFAVAIGQGLTTLWLEMNHVGAKGPDFATTFPERCLVAGRAFWFYIGKLIWPANLCFVYPHWKLDVASLGQWFYPVTALVVLYSFWRLRKRIGRGPAAGAFFFVGTLFPLLGFMNAYGMRYAFVWNHWVYLPSLGLIALATALVVRGTDHFHQGFVFKGLAVVVLLVLMVLTRRECKTYTDLETLWRTTIVRNPGCWMAHNNLGDVFDRKGQTDEAIHQFQEAIRLKPDYAEAHKNFGNALLKQGRLDKAIGQYKEAIRLDPDYTRAHNNLGTALEKKGRLDEAVEQYKKAIEIEPDYAEAHYNLGNTLGQKGQLDEAVSQYREAIRLKPGDAEAHNNLAVVLDKQGKVDEAIEQLQAAIRLKPDYAEAHYNLGTALGQEGRTAEAIEQYQSGIRLRPDFVEAYDKLAKLLAGEGRLDEAVSCYRAEIRLKPNAVDAEGNLGNVLAAQGRFAEAIKEYQATLTLVPESAQAHFRYGQALVAQHQYAAGKVEFQKALALKPQDAQVCINLAWLLATCPEASLRNGKEAVELAAGVKAQGGEDSPQVLDTLAAAYAEAGRFSEAVALARRALDLPAMRNDPPSVEAIEARLKLYKTNTPFHEKP